MGRAAEARRAIDEARRADAGPPEGYLAEGLLNDVAGDRVAAKAAYDKAIDHKSDNAYAYYRSAVLALAGNPDKAALAPIDALLTQAVGRNTRFAGAYAALGEVRAAMNEDDEPVSLVRRAISLEPAEPAHHLSAARIFWRRAKWEQALAEARTAERLARDEDEKAEAQRTAASIEQARPH
jgi:tetratricopeptide (TPR) repeat protein